MPHDAETDLQPGDAVIVVDVQNDFCPGGALPIGRGDEIVPVLNRWMAAAEAAGVPVFASRDWHPERHMSFAPEGGPWPIHCVQDSEGAAFHPRLELPADAVVVTKGDRIDREQYSALDGTGLADELRRYGVRRAWVGGLAEDVCVRATALDAVREGFETRLIPAGSLPVTPEGGAIARNDMAAAGVHVS